MPEDFIEVTSYLGTVFEIRFRNRFVSCVQCSDAAVKNKHDPFHLLLKNVSVRKCGINLIDRFFFERKDKTLFT